jgi:hypothetical protein
MHDEHRYVDRSVPQVGLYMEESGAPTWRIEQGTGLRFRECGAEIDLARSAALRLTPVAATRRPRGGSMSTPEDNIKVILADWLDALRRQDLDAIEHRMAPEVFWQGIREDFVCVDRDEAMSLLREQQREDYGVEALELVATEEKVVLGVRSTQLQEVGGVPLGGQIFQVFTLRDGIIVRVDEYERRIDALEAADAEGRGDWQ